MARNPDSSFIFDMGPPKPTPPVEPPTPVGVEGDPTFELQKLGYRLAKADYLLALAEYEVKFKEWEKYKDGPIRIDLPVWNVNEAIQNDQLAVREGRQEKPRYYRIKPE